MTSAFDHCENLVREADKDRFLASLFAPADRRRDLLALYAFNADVAGIRDRAGEALPGEMRLQWWREALEGVRRDEARANPVAAALLDALARHGLPAADLVELIDARTFDLYDDPMPTLAALETYARLTSSRLMVLAGRILGATDGSITDVAGPAGIAYAITGLLRAFAFHASRRQLYVPRDILDRHGVGADEVFTGTATAGLHLALAELRGHVRRHLAAIGGPLAALPAAAIPALLPVALVPGHLARMERQDYDPFRTPIELPQWRRQWALWRSARRGIRLPVRT
ncbi:MAG: phytoene/squalene synthase family protein [Xanthobacteraceae bacterium]|jgi:phytoene synthase